MDVSRNFACDIFGESIATKLGMVDVKEVSANDRRGELRPSIPCKSCIHRDVAWGIELGRAGWRIGRCVLWSRQADGER